MSESLLTKMSVRGCNWQSVAGGTIDISEFDVAAALSFGNLSRPAYYLARAKYLDDAEALNWMKQHFSHQVLTTFAIDKSKNIDDKVSGLADLIVKEGMFGIHCKDCEGLGVIYSRNVLKPIVGNCKSCNGTGHGRLSERERARTANIPVSSWNRKWKEKIYDFYNYVSDLNDEVISHVRRQFKN